MLLSVPTTTATGARVLILSKQNQCRGGPVLEVVGEVISRGPHIMAVLLYAYSFVVTR